ncbi:MAG TPA: HAMP domain-containing sensor histidine kinase [Pseudonocardia sp.]
MIAATAPPRRAGGSAPRRAPARAAAWARALPLRTRMLAAVLALMCAVFVVIAPVSLALLHRSLIDELDQKVLQAVARREPPPGQEARYRRGPLSFLAHTGQTTGTLGAVLHDGRIVDVGTLDPDGDVRPLEPPAGDPLMTLPADGAPHTVNLAGLGDYRILAKPAGSGDVEVTGLPMDDVRDVLRQLTVIQIWAAAFGLAVTGVAAAVIVRVALRPLRRVAATATRVAEQPLDRGRVALDERVPATEVDPRTEVGQVGAALNRMLEHLGTALDARYASELRLRQFLADASHELRTPLAAIRGYAELAGRRHDDVSPTVAHVLRRVSSQTERMTSLVEDMLLLARLDAGRPLAHEPVELSQLVVDAVSDAHAAGPEHRWRLSLPDRAVTVPGDPVRLGQVLGNLLTNARVHTPPGTAVLAELVVRGERAVLRVTDDGPGIAAELLPQVFGRFARGDGSRSREAGSTGLGLAIAHAVTGAHGGTIRVTSEPGRTAFTVELPAAVEAPRHPVGPSGPAVRTTAG